MQQHRTTPKQQHTTGCYSTLTIAVLPLIIYFLQLLGKFSSIAACAAGVLVIAKIAIEYHHHISHKSRRSSLTPPVPAAVFLPPPVAGCYLCQKVRSLREYLIAPGRRVGVCQHCYGSLEATRHRT